jgi:hypothetical protein
MSAAASSPLLVRKGAAVPAGSVGHGDAPRRARIRLRIERALGVTAEQRRGRDLACMSAGEAGAPR